MTRTQPLYLCAGPQSSGSTVVSWCFLQRADLDGVFDARNDILPKIPPVAAPRVWCKITISSFRFSEMKAYYEDEGWEVHPLLVARDVRAVFNSLSKKHYGRNGITAEEPPLRMRLRRFKEDWALFQRMGWPVVRYETLVSDPEQTLRRACEQLALPWDEGMMTWPKQKEALAAPGHGNPTFRQNVGATFAETVNPSLAALTTRNVPPNDLAWMEQEFAEFNRALGYPLHAEPEGDWTGREQRAIPSFENTRRFRKAQRPLRRLSAAFSRLASGVASAVTRRPHEPQPAGMNDSD